MSKSKLPKTDSIQKLAEFWDTHDLTDFDDELKEVDESVFARRGAIQVPLDSRDMKTVQKLAQSKGVSPAQLVRDWMLQKLARGNGRAAKR